MKIVVINGYPCSGKDTFIDICKKMIDIEAYSIIDSVKDVAYHVGWSGTKSDKDRKFLCDLKDLLTEYNDYPMWCTIDATEDMEANWEIPPDVFFITMRQPEDIERYKERFPEAVTLFIQCDDAKAEYLESEIKNDADSGVEDYIYDYYISNNGTLDDLRDAAELFLKELEVI